MAAGYRVEEEGLLCQILKQAYRNRGLTWQPGTFQSHSDANLLKQGGCQPVILGPGQLARAHTRDEAVLFEQVAAAAELYREMLGMGCDQ